MLFERLEWRERSLRAEGRCHKATLALVAQLTPAAKVFRLCVTATPIRRRVFERRLLLFCRLPGEQYVCCGRLGYVSHVPDRQPLKFVWRLLDLPALQESEAFRELLAAA